MADASSVRPTFRLWLAPATLAFAAALMALALAFLPIWVGATGGPVPRTNCGSAVFSKAAPANEDISDGRASFSLICSSQVNTRRSEVALDLAVVAMLAVGATALKRRSERDTVGRKERENQPSVFQRPLRVDDMPAGPPLAPPSEPGTEDWRPKSP